MRKKHPLEMSMEEISQLGLRTPAIYDVPEKPCEKPRKPTSEEKYSPCRCGSGRKFKFCCGRRR